MIRYAQSLSPTMNPCCLVNSGNGLKLFNRIPEIPRSELSHFSLREKVCLPVRSYFERRRYPSPSPQPLSRTAMQKESRGRCHTYGLYDMPSSVHHIFRDKPPGSYLDTALKPSSHPNVGFNVTWDGRRIANQGTSLLGCIGQSVRQDAWLVYSLTFFWPAVRLYEKDGRTSDGCLLIGLTSNRYEGACDPSVFSAF